MTSPVGQAGPSKLRFDLLGIYLNDHLAGATGGLELCRRTARATRGTPRGDTLARLAAEITEDRAALVEVMRTLGVPIRRYKAYAGWLAEKAGRAKLNGSLLRRSPLSTALELEGLRIGVEGKAAGWRTLRTLTDVEPRLDADLLDSLLSRAQAQANTLEELRVRSVEEALKA